MGITRARIRSSHTIRDSSILAGRPRHRTHQRTNREPIRTGTTMKHFLRKIFKRKPKYEPAGIVHYGEWRFGDYYAQATPNGTHHVWHHDEYLGEYKGQRIEIVEHLHAKDQK